MHGHGGRQIAYEHTTWPGRTLRTDRVAALLGIQPASLHQLVARHAFPPGYPQGRERSWPLDVVLRFIVAHRRQLLARVPRLFPRIEPIPALFCGSFQFVLRSQSGGRQTSCVAFLWQPSDALGRVALAYPLDHNLWQPADVLAALRAAYSDVDAVVIPQTTTSVGEDGVLNPPDVDYADTREPGLRIREMSWLDLAYLLQVDLPWWPSGLRDAQSMLRWQPDSPPYDLVPTSPSTGDPHAILRLGATVHPDARRDVCAPFFQWFAETAACVACPPKVSGAKTVPGIRVSARAVAPGTGAALRDEVASGKDRPTTSEIAAVLHSQVDPAALDQQVKMWAHIVGAWSPLIERVVAVRIGSANPLARRFLNRLRESPGPNDELGFAIVAAHGLSVERASDPLTTAAPRRLEHEVDPDLWIARYGNTVYTSVPQVISTAVGELRELDITQERGQLLTDFTAWWTDGGGNAWPVPGCESHTAGYEGSGPSNLAAAATILAYDATAPVGGRHNRAIERDLRCQELEQILSADHYPTLVRRFVPNGKEFRWHTSGE